MTETMLTDSTLIVVALAVLAAVAFGVSVMSWRTARRWRGRAAALEAAIAEVRQDVRGLCAGAVGLDERIARIEQNGRRLKERQEQLELRDGGERLYNQAIRMVHKGCTIEELVEVCGVSRNEAALLMMMHSVDKAS